MFPKLIGSLAMLHESGRRGPSWAHLVVIGGRLYLRCDTNLYCVDVKAG